ncbi:MAG: hypothetical protein ACSNEK_07305 [Parachlamydiaceae bacterium]
MSSRVGASLSNRDSFPSQRTVSSLKKISKLGCCCACLKRLVSRIYHFFSRIFRGKASGSHDWANRRFEKSNALIPYCLNLLHHPRQSVILNEEILLSEEELMVRKRMLSDREVAIKAAEKTGFPKVKPLELQSIGQLEARRFENDEEFSNEILPTSYLVAYPKHPSVNHLANVFKLYLDGQGRGVIRSGKIDSSQRAEDFASLLRSVRDQAIEESESNGRVLRVMSHQLNSYEMEKSFIDGQHRSLAKINQKYKDDFEIAHINTPTVRFYDWSKKIEKMPKVMQPLHKALRNSEAASRKQNLEAWGTYFKWLMTDLEAHLLEESDWQGLEESIEHHVEQIQSLLCQEADLLRSSPRPTKEIRKVRKEISQHRKELSIKLNASLEGLNYLRQNLDQGSQEYRKADLFYRVLSSQLKIPGHVLHRGHEQLLIQLLNKEMHVTAAVNCRSGLDRTGYLHSVMVSLEQISKSHDPQDVHRMAVNWDRFTADINLTPRAEIEQLVKQSEDVEGLKTVIEFRKLFIHNLLKIGLPITTLNTGYVGFKWQSGVYFNLVENLIPLNFLPPTIRIIKNKQEVVVKLVKYSKRTGMPIGLTSHGRQLLTPLSEMRGA